MKRLIIVAVVCGVVAGIFWAMASSLQHEPSRRGETAAVILRPPEGFSVDQIGDSTVANAAKALQAMPDDRVGVEFSDGGDRVILLADRGAAEIVEMRAAATGTLVERTWAGDVDRRLAWAADNGNFDTPGLVPATGKNLYH